MHVLTVKLDAGTSYELHMLNPRETFPGFGGSRAGLLVGKTASLVSRMHTPNTTSDTEHDIHDPVVWEAIGRWINQGTAMAALKVLATTPAIRAWLQANDPQALAQADKAIGESITAVVPARVELSPESRRARDKVGR